MKFRTKECEVIDELVIELLEGLHVREGIDVQRIIDFIGESGVDWEEIQQELLEQRMVFDQNLWDQYFVVQCSSCGDILDEGWCWKDELERRSESREWFCEECAMLEIVCAIKHKRKG